MSERTFEPMTKAEVVAAQRAWARYVTDQDVDRLLDLYDFGTPDEPLLFKPPWPMSSGSTAPVPGRTSSAATLVPTTTASSIGAGRAQVPERSGPDSQGRRSRLQGYGPLHLRRRRRKRHPRRLHLRLSQARRSGADLAPPLLADLAAALGRETPTPTRSGVLMPASSTSTCSTPSSTNARAGSPSARSPRTATPACPRILSRR